MFMYELSSESAWNLKRPLWSNPFPVGLLLDNFISMSEYKCLLVIFCSFHGCSLFKSSWLVLVCISSCCYLY